MKILLITKLIHPTQSPRAFRATELAKELGLRGHNVTLYANIGNYDYQSFEEEYQVAIRDIGTMYFALKDSDGSYSRPYFQKGLRRLFGKWLYMPDIEFFWKVPYVLKQEADVDLLITVAVPHSIHWGAAWYKLRHSDTFPSVWIGDCGDPFMGNKFRQPPSYFAYLEKLFCRQADYITIPIEEARPAYYPECQDKIKIIPQGFRFDLPLENILPDNKVPTFLYAGNFYPPERDPRPFLDHLVQLEQPFRFIIFTRHKDLVAGYKAQLEDKLEINEFIQRSDLIIKMRKMDFLVNFNNNTALQSPSKLIDYAIAGRPVLSLDSQKISSTVVSEFLNGDYSHALQIENIDQFRIEKVTDQFLELYHKNK